MYILANKCKNLINNGSDYMKYNYKDYEAPLCDEMKKVILD